MRRLAAQSALFLVLWPAGTAVHSATCGPLAVSLQYGRPLLCWSNTPGEAYVIETARTLAPPVWQPRATITTDAPEVAWADDSAPPQARFYRITLSTNPGLFRTLQQALQRGCTNDGIVGASAAAMLPEAGLWMGTWGTSDGKLPIRPHTPFEVGSITKTFVAATILRLAEEGRLSLDDTVGHWLPQVTSPNIAPGITVRQLLNHHAGIYNFGDDLDFRQALFRDWSRVWNPEDVLPYVKAPYFQPGSDGQYSNTGYVLLGMIIRSVTGSTLAEEMRRTVLDRAGLRSTVMGAEESWLGVLADPHLDFDGDGIHEDLGAYSQTSILTSFWTSGAEISTAADLVQFGLSLFEGGLLSQTSLQEMRTFESIDIGGSRYDYGLGLMRFNVLWGEYWAHSGGLFGEYAWFSYCPSSGICMAVTYNYPGSSLAGELLVALADLSKTAPAYSTTRLDH